LPYEEKGAANMANSAENTPNTVMPDWTREAPRRWWDPGPQLLKTIRRYQRQRGRPGLFSNARRRYYVVWHRFWSVVSGADIPLNSHIAGGLVLIHPNGVVIHPDSEVGPNCMLFQQVTLGTQHDEQAPVLGADVLVGAGAKILGGVRIGDHARIGANAVVLCDVPDHATAVGIPARILMRS